MAQMMRIGSWNLGAASRGSRVASQALPTAHCLLPHSLFQRAVGYELAITQDQQTVGHAGRKLAVAGEVGDRPWLNRQRLKVHVALCCQALVGSSRWSMRGRKAPPRDLLPLADAGLVPS